MSAQKLFRRNIAILLSALFEDRLPNPHGIKDCRFF